MEKNSILKNVFISKLKEIKTRLPKKCTYLSPIETALGILMIRCVVDGEEWRYSTPHNLIFTEEDWNELERSIKEKCNTNVQ